MRFNYLHPIIWGTVFLLAAPSFALAQPMPSELEASASEPVQTGALTEAQLMTRALSQNPALLAAQEALEAARSEQKSVQALLWPALAFNGQFTAGSTERMSMPVPGIEPANMSMRPRGLSANLNVSAMMPIYTGGKLQAQIEGAQRRVQQLEADYTTRRLEIRAELQQALLQRRLLQAQIELLDSEIAGQQADLHWAQQGFELGKQPRYIVLRAQSELSLLQQQLNLGQLELAQQELEVRNLAALPPDAVLAPALALEPVQISRPLPQLAEAWHLALERSPQLAALQAQLAQAETRVQIASASYLPFVYLVGVYEQRVPEIPDMNYTSGGAIDLLISLPVFDGFGRDAERERFQREANQLINQRSEVLNRLQTDIGKRLLELATLQTNLKLSQIQLEQSNEEERIARLRYQGGKAILLELLDAANQRRKARLSQLEISFNYQLACIELDRLLALEDSDAEETGLIQR